MHEWRIAEYISHLAKEAKKVIIEVGELQGINIGILRDILSSMLKVRFEIVEVPASIRCLRCNHLFGMDEVKLGDEEREMIHFFPEVYKCWIRCPRCGSIDLKVEKGRGIHVKLL